ncbi:MAG: Panacea domain-containing protein [bacterium]
MQLRNTPREKLLHAILYFASNVKNPSKIKIFKLLYFFNFEHFRNTGQSVTNLDYYAFDFGPVPKEFYQEINENRVPSDFLPYLTIIPFTSEESGKKGGMFEVKKKPDLTIFSPRQQKILEKLAFTFKDVDAGLISDVSHFKNHLWDRTIKEKGKFSKIDYLLAIDEDAKISAEDAHELLREKQEMYNNFPPSSTI